MTIVEQALQFVADGQVLGLGTGRAATDFVSGLGKRIQQGLHIRGLPTSQKTADLAKQLGIPLITFADVAQLDIAFDGADEVDPQLNLIKGFGGALVREKVVAAAARRFVILVGSEKVVTQLGQLGRLPVEVIPFGVECVQRRIAAIAGPAPIRQDGGKPFVTDNGNLILDVKVQPIADPAKLELQLRQIPGVVGTGLFLGMASTVLIQHAGRVEVRHAAST